MRPCLVRALSSCQFQKTDALLSPLYFLPLPLFGVVEWKCLAGSFKFSLARVTNSKRVLIICHMPKPDEHFINQPFHLFLAIPDQMKKVSKPAWWHPSTTIDTNYHRHSFLFVAWSEFFFVFASYYLKVQFAAIGNFDRLSAKTSLGLAVIVSIFRASTITLNIRFLFDSVGSLPEALRVMACKNVAALFFFDPPPLVGCVVVWLLTP